MRAHRSLAPAAAVVVLLLAACGSGAEDDAGDAAPTVAAEADDPGGDPAAFPVTIDHQFGTTTIPELPERVVSVGFTESDVLLALGVVPVGLRDWYGDQPNGVWPWARDALGDATPELLGSEELSFEAVAALDPDLIVGVSSGMTADDYDLLSEIAPTVAQSGEYIDFGTPWQEETLRLGQAVGRTQQAEQLVADIEARYVEIREENPGFEGSTAAVSFFFESAPGVYASEDTRSRLLTELGFAIPAAYDELAGESFFASISEERLDLLDTDVVVWIVGADEQQARQIRELPLRQNLDAVDEGRELFLDVELSAAFSFSSPLSIPFLLDALVPELAAAVDGDPGTPVESAQED